jgi:hypothetical protein
MAISRGRIEDSLWNRPLAPRGIGGPDMNSTFISGVIVDVLPPFAAI